jgi:hypothetical protein
VFQLRKAGGLFDLGSPILSFLYDGFQFPPPGYIEGFSGDGFFRRDTSGRAFLWKGR